MTSRALAALNLPKLASLVDAARDVERLVMRASQRFRAFSIGLFAVIPSEAHWAEPSVAELTSLRGAFIKDLRGAISQALRELLRMTQRILAKDAGRNCSDRGTGTALAQSNMPKAASPPGSRSPPDRPLAGVRPVKAIAGLVITTTFRRRSWGTCGGAVRLRRSRLGQS